MEFRTQYSKRIQYVQDPGCPIKESFVGQYNKEGQLELVSTGSYNLYDEIQSHKDSVDINVILKRYMSGDTSVLSRVQGTYGDFTQMPKSLAEAMNITMKAEDDFNHLPIEIKEKFGNNFVQYISELGSEAWLEKIGIAQKDIKESSENQVEKEVNE